MLRNLSRTFLIAGAAWLAAASALGAQTGTGPVRGDVNGDGRITTADARIVADYLVGRPVPPGADVANRGDVNGDGRVTSVDAAIINGFAAGRDVSRFKVGTAVTEVPANALAEFICNADVGARTVRCNSPAELAGGARGIIIGSQGVNVKLTSSNVVVTPGTGDFTFDVTVQNLIPQRLGADSLGATGSADSVRVFFSQKPTPTGPGDSGEIGVDAQMGTFTESNQFYYAYAAPLDSGEVSEAVNWHFQIPNTVSNFVFRVFVDASVQYPDGWVTLSPPAPRAFGPYYVTPPAAVDTVSRDPQAPNYRAAFKAGAIVRTRTGKVPDDTTVTWQTSAASVATVVDAGIDSANVAFVGDGDVTITAANTSHEGDDGNHLRSGKLNFVVRSADTTTSTISGNPTNLPVGDSSLITVQLKNAAGMNLTQSGGTVALFANNGATLGAVTNNHDGTYTAWLKNTTAGAVTVTGTLNNHTLVNTATITFTAGAVDHFVVEAAAGGPIPDQLSGTPFNVKVTAKDQFNNTATSFTGTVGFTSTPAGQITAGGTSAAFTAGVLASHAITIVTPDTYTLTATRTGGTEAGTSNSFQVQLAPTAVVDGPTPTSAPGDPYHTAFNTTFTLPTLGVMANDTRGLPLATVVSFGADSLGGTVTDHAAGTSTGLPGHADGSLVVNADGSVSFTPPTGFTGLYVFKYRISNVRGTSDAQVTIAVGTRPAANNDTYPVNLLGNVPINTATSTNFRVTTNDAGDAKVLAIGTAQHGVATLNADSTFTFRPDAGYTGPASFTYTVKNGFGTSAPGTVNMTVSGIAWFVNTAGAPGGDGRFDAPFTNLNTAYAAAVKPVANQPVFLYSSAGGYTGGVTLAAGQRLVGQGATGASFAAVMGVTWPADAGTQPSIGGTLPGVASGLTLGSGNTLQGFNLTSGTLTANSFGTLTVSEVGINTTGQALSLTTGTLAGAGFTQVRSTGGTNNVLLSGVATSGTPALGTSADALSGATADAFVISGGNGSFTYAGMITNTATLAVNVSGKTGGTVLFSGDINPAAAAKGISASNNSSGTNTITFSGANQKISSGTAAGVNLANNAGATISFTGGGLVIASTTGNGFSATGGGIVIVDGATDNSTIASSGGIALNVVNTTIGTGGLNFKSIAATGGTSGIVLNNTGATNGLTVNGDGASDAANTTRGRTTAKSGGGTVALGSGGTLSGTTSHAVDLSTTGAVVLRNMVIQNGGGDGISATSVSALTVDNALITGKASGHGIHGTTLAGLNLLHSDVGNNATAAGVDATDTWNLRFQQLSGTATVQNSLIHNSLETVFGVINTSGTLTLAVTNSNITDTYPVGGVQANAPGTNGLQINAYGSSVINATLTNDSIARTRARGVTASTETAGSGSLSLTVTGTKFADNTTGGLEIAHGSSGTATYNFSSNDFQRHGSIPINVNRLGSGTFSSFGDFTGTIQNNVIGSATPNSGTTGTADGLHVESNGTGGNTRVAIVNNTIQQVGQYGIYLAVVDTKIGGVAQPNLEARVQGNSVTNLKAAALDGLRVVPAALAGDHGRVCLDVISNTLATTTGYGWRIRTSVPLSGTPPTPTINLKGWNGTDAFATYAVNRPNTLSGASGTAIESHGSGSLVAVASCTTP